MQDTAAKLGMGAIIAVLATGREVYGEALWTVVLFWCTDMLLGFLRALRDPGEELQWGKVLDGIMRLLVILTVPVIVHLASQFPESIWEIDLGDKPALFVIGLLGAQEFFSAIDNAVFLVPGLERWRARLIRWDPGERPRSSHAEVLIMRETPDEETDTYESD